MAQTKFKMTNGKFFVFAIAIYLLIIVFPRAIFAQSSYVLPYPSAMPGSIFYKTHLVWEEIMKYWYFGNFGQFAYNLKQSDKYLVEAKTLFEYKQFLLAYTALMKSDSYFAQSPLYLGLAKKENKDIEDKKNILKNAALKHTEVLEFLKNEVPEKFEWTPEKSSPTKLNLEEAISKSIEIRKNNL
ncbi:MAG: DUF5667 domain-containing protein [Candidatus Levybacteria bacterium]|nr:DUF5667 domain-containing protein [Candidatus Levybacteria bacterium]